MAEENEAGEVEAPEAEDAVAATEEAQQDDKPSEGEEQATDADEAAEGDDTSQPAQEEPEEPTETATQRRRRQRRERIERLKEESRAKDAEIAALQERVEAFQEVDPETAADYDDAVEQNRINRALRKAEEVRLEQAKKAREGQAQTAQQDRAQIWQDRVAAEIDDVDDFNKKIASVSDMDLGPASKHLEEAIVEMDHGPQVALHLANDRTKLASLRGMSPVQLGIELAKIEAGIDAKPKPKPKMKSGAPKPAKPVKGTGAADVDIESMSIEELEKHRGF